MADGGRLAAQLQAAYQRQLRANQASMSEFVQNIASICESFNVASIDGSALDAPSIASVFRELPSASGSSPQQPSVSLAVAPARSEGKQEIYEAETQFHAGRISKGNVESKKQMVNDALPPDYVLEDSAIKLLPFINEDGTIARPMPVLQRVLGPKFGAAYTGFEGALKFWKPVGGPLASFVHSRFFQLVSVLVIVANFFFIVAQSDFKVSNVGEEEPSSMFIVGHAFTAWYTLELICTMAVLGNGFIIGKEFGWNLFDFAIVSVSWFEIIMDLLGGSSGSTSFLRIIRFMRISRVLRMFAAMRMFKEIKIMVDCLAGSLSIFFFCSIMLGLFLSLFAVFFVQGLGTLIEGGTDHVDPIALANLKRWFGTVADAMLSLFVCATGGDDWRMYFEVIKVLGPQYNYLFLLFVDFYMFAFVNVVVGVFCEKAVSLAAPTTAELMSRRYDKEFADAEELYELLDNHIEHEDHQRNPITAEKFRHFIADPEVEKYFEVRGLKTSSAMRFFKMLCDLNGSDRVDYGAFVSAVVALDGQASCIDLHVISVRQLHGIHQMNETINTHHAEALTGLDAMHGKLHTIRSHVEGGAGKNSSADLQTESQPQFQFGAQLWKEQTAQLSTIEAEIKELRKLAASPMQSRIGSRAESEMMGACTPMMSPHGNFQPALLSRDPTESLVMDTPRSEGLPSNKMARYETVPSQSKSMDAPQNTANDRALEDKVRTLEGTLKSAQDKQRDASDALEKSGRELEAAKVKKKQLEQLVSLQDAREAELQRQIATLRSTHDQELTRLERTRADLSDQVRVYEQRCNDLQADRQMGHLRPPQPQPQPGGNGMFDWTTCGTPRNKVEDPRMR